MGMTPADRDALTLIEQVHTAYRLLILLAVMFPPLFFAADWLRYGGA